MAMSRGTILAPTAVLMPNTTIHVYTILCTFWMHPGSTHASNLIGLFRDVFDLFENAVSTERALSKSASKWQHGGRASDSKSPFAGDVNMTARSWSLEGAGTHGTPRPCDFMSQGRRLSMWLQNEVRLDESIVKELHEGPSGSAQQWMAGGLLSDQFLRHTSEFQEGARGGEAAHLLAPAPFGLETSLSHMSIRIAEVSCGRPARNVSICL